MKNIINRVEYLKEASIGVPKKVWNESDLEEEVSKWGNIHDFMINAPGAYAYLRKNPRLYRKILGDL